MGQVSFVQPSFLGGEVSQSYQGRIDRPDYRTFLNVCLNTIPIATGAALRRGGTRSGGQTRGGAPAKVLQFEFENGIPYSMEFTDGFLRFRLGPNLVTTNDENPLIDISTATPAVVQTAGQHNWSTANTVLFRVDGANRLLNRQCGILVISPGQFSIFDTLTGAPIDGSDLGSAFISGSVRRVLEIATPYTGDSWMNVRAVQAENRAILLNGTQPQVLAVDQQPTETTSATLDLSAADFLDGPYLDPIPGSWVTASALSGVVTLTLSFQTYSAAIAYNIGDYVTSAGAHYKSRTAANQNNTPASSPTNWLPVNGGDPINAGSGFIAADIGRLIRLYSEPPLWDAATTYTAGQRVTYNDGSSYGYWKATGSISAGNKPGEFASWAPDASAARWTWGRVRSVDATGIASPDSAIGSMTGGGGVASAIDGNTSKSLAAAANASASVTTYQAWFAGVWALGAEVQYANIVYRKIRDAIPAYGDDLWNFAPPSVATAMWLPFSTTADLTFSAYVGAHYASPVGVQSVTVYPTADVGFTTGAGITLNLRGKATIPSLPADGTLLGSASIANTFSSISILSNDTLTTFSYLWIEAVATYVQPLPDQGGNSYTGYIGIAQIQMFAPAAANGSVISAQIAGDPLLYSSAVRKWRLGVYGGTNGWPTCGTYDEGRLWLSGVVGNRVDGSKPLNDSSPRNVFDFAPTAPSGVVAADNAIAAVATGKKVNKILWMVPDEQGIICGTHAGEWLVAPASPGALSPTNVSFRPKTTIGCADVEPCFTDMTLAFVQAHGRRLMEYFADVNAGKFTAPDLAEKAKHLTKQSLVQIAFQKELAPVIWGRRADGSLVGATYRRDSLLSALGPTFTAWHRHTLGSGRSIESICIGASIGGDLDALTMVTNDPDTGVRHVEVLTDLLDEGFVLGECWLVDGGVAPTSVELAAPTVDMPYGGLTLYGLWPLNGKTVTPVIAGLDCGTTTGVDADGHDATIVSEFTVANGSITVPFGDGVSAGTADGLFTEAFLTAISSTFDLTLVKIAVGFPFTSDGQIVPPMQPPEAGSQAGPGFAKEQRIHRFGVKLYGAINGRISFGTAFDRLHPAQLNSPGGTPYTLLQPWSGVFRSEPEGDSEFGSMLCWRIERPVPAFVIAFGGTVQTQDG